MPAEKSEHIGPVELVLGNEWASLSMMSVLVSFLTMLAGVVRSRAALHIEVLALRHHYRSSTVTPATVAPHEGRPVALGVAVNVMALMANGADYRQARDGHRVASSGPSPVVDVEKSTTRGATIRPGRRPQPDSDHVAGESVVGRPSDSWRVVETGFRRLSGIRREVHDPSCHTAITNLAHVPGQPPPANRGRRFLRRSDGHVPAVVRAGHPRARTSPCRARRGHGPPHAAWTAQQLREAFPWNEAPRYLVHDRDSAFRAWTTTAAAIGVEEILTAPRAPWQNAYAERLIGSIRRECLDHVIIANERGLRRALNAYVEYYLGSRTHLSLNKDAPVSRPVGPPGDGAIVAIPHLGGLHHRYERRAA